MLRDPRDRVVGKLITQLSNVKASPLATPSISAITGPLSPPITSLSLSLALF